MLRKKCNDEIEKTASRFNEATEKVIKKSTIPHTKCGNGALFLYNYKYPYKVGVANDAATILDDLKFLFRTL